MSDSDTTTTTTTSAAKPEVVPKQYLLAFILTTCCFSLWGFANDFTNPLVKVYEQVFIITTGQATLLQFAFYTGYFCMALPAAFFIRKFSYKAAIMVGFAFYALGALMAIPASITATFWIFVVGSYILTYGLAFLETACNPYILSMGPAATATQRLNLAQAFNPIGSLCGMFIASQVLAPSLLTVQLSKDIREGKPEATQYLITDPATVAPAGVYDEKAEKVTFTEPEEVEVDVYTDGLPNFETESGALGDATTNALKTLRATDPEKFDEIQKADLASVRQPYMVVAGVVIAFLIIFAFSKMPSFQKDEPDAPFMEITGRIFSRAHFRLGVLAQLFYVGAQIMCWTFVVHYGMSEVGLTLGEAQSWNIAAMVIFLSSRWICTFLLRYISPGRMLFAFALGGIVFTLGAILLPGKLGMTSLILISACMSLMFPTIYGIALKNMAEEEAKLGSAFLIMSIVGGALLTQAQGFVIDASGVRTSFVLPIICFLFIAFYGFKTFSTFEKEDGEVDPDASLHQKPA